jgi:nucleoside-diphosphate-sugar epimerase
MRVLVTGASGAIGPRVVRAFWQKGYQVRTFSIDASPSGMFPPNTDIIVGDITDQVAVRSAVRDMDAVVHMAGLLHINNPLPELREKFEYVNISGTANLVDSAIREGARRIVLFSTIAVYGSIDGQTYNEKSSVRPETCYAKAKLDAEKIILNARRDSGEPIGVVLRLGAVYGSRVKGNYKRMVEALAHNRFIPVGDGLNKRTLVYDEDVAVATILAMEHPVAAGRVYNVTDGNCHTLNEIISAICKALGRKQPRISLPAAAARFAAGMLEDGARLCGRCSPITRATIDKYTEDIAVDGSRIQKELRFIPQYDLDTGWREAIQEMRERGIL